MDIHSAKAVAIHLKEVDARLKLWEQTGTITQFSKAKLREHLNAARDIVEGKAIDVT